MPPVMPLLSTGCAWLLSKMLAGFNHDAPFVPNEQLLLRLLRVSWQHCYSSCDLVWVGGIIAFFRSLPLINVL